MCRRGFMVASGRFSYATSYKIIEPFPARNLRKMYAVLCALAALIHNCFFCHNLFMNALPASSITLYSLDPAK
jgi:hypothetical protein